MDKHQEILEMGDRLTFFLEKKSILGENKPLPYFCYEKSINVFMESPNVT